ncbi:MAG: hypothetical protein EOP83_16185 [Verrucomicrobiaceae bacterium]|nr:MAG: hypothetical protein EOP83_16185 [Verrucomicrobiaceae bacterium]
MKMREIMRLVEGRSIEIDWVPPRRGPGYAVVWVDVKKIDASWSRDYVYVGPGGEGGTGRRYAGFGKWLETRDVPVEMSELGIGGHGWIVFTNGRHRFSWMRDHGVRALPVLVPEDEVEAISQQFGTSERRSVIHAD